MNENDEILKGILLAKEKRSLLKESIKNEGYVSLSFSLNIPGYPKTNNDITAFFDSVLAQLKIFLSANRIEIITEYYQTDEVGNIFISSIKSSCLSIQNIKQLCETFEERHELGRLIDIDITDSDGKYISSGKNKLCYYCGSFSALDCMLSKRHEYADLRNFIFKKIQSYLLVQQKEKICSTLASFASRAMLYEISLTPKPGLVDFNNAGKHKDMDYYTFLDSSSVIGPSFYKIAEKGFLFNKSFSSALPSIREIGLVMEKEMFEVTKGVNTQKGIIFLMGVAVFASAKLISEKGLFDKAEFSAIVKNIGENLLSEFDENVSENTHGKICVKKYGKQIGGGARYEVAEGFKTTIKYGFNTLNDSDLENINTQEKQKVLFKTLLLLVGNNNDTNIIFRSNTYIQEELKLLAMKAFNSKSEDEKKNNYKILKNFCLEKNISPGGSADMLAVAVFLYLVKNKF